VRDKDLILTGDYGSYDQQQGRAEIWGHVRGRDLKGRTIESDRIVYLRDQEIAQARGRVIARDSTEAITLTAEALDYDKNAQVSRATINPKLVQLARGGKGAVTLTGDTVTVNQKDRIAHAEGRVHVVQDSLEANAGRAIYYDAEHRGLLLDSPRASTGEVTVRGESLEVFTKGKALDRMKVHGKGAIDYRGGGGAGQASTLTADRMEMWFSGDAIDSLTAMENAANEFTGAPVPGRRPETNRTEGNLMRLRFEDKELKQAIVTGNAKGVYSGESALADTIAARTDSVQYEAGKITFEVRKNRIGREDHAQLTYLDLSLLSPEVVFDAK
jgi:lipopolysaccharide export system protein LptA